MEEGDAFIVLAKVGGQYFVKETQDGSELPAFPWAKRAIVLVGLGQASEPFGMALKYIVDDLLYAVPGRDT